MEKEWTRAELLDIENQLSCPSGEKGVEMGEMMNETNIEMTRSSIRFLDIKDQHTILELGHGNCGHLDNILSCAEGIRYSGLEISETMQREAKEKNKYLLTNEHIEFRLYKGQQMPFPDHSFDRVMTVNTVYFWPKPAEF